MTNRCVRWALAALAILALGATPALALSRAEKRQNARIRTALRIARGAARAAKKNSKGLAKQSSTLKTLASALDTTITALLTLNDEVNNPNTGLGQVDNGVVSLYIQQGGSGTSPAFNAVLFAPNVPLYRGNGATTSGTTVVTCTTAPCTLSAWAAINSNKPQSTGPVAQVGGGLVVSSINSTTGAESFYTAGQTPPSSNPAYAGSPVVDIPRRRPLVSNYPSPNDPDSVIVPITVANPATPGANGTVTLTSAGSYIVHGTASFLKIS